MEHGGYAINMFGLLDVSGYDEISITHPSIPLQSLVNGAARYGMYLILREKEPLRVCDILRA